ncbi:wax ester/triacylglycerol synthase domain-containing protein [Mycolicibacterium sp. XJ1904]
MGTTRLSVNDAFALHTQTSTTPAHTVALLVIEASDRLSHQRLNKLVLAALPQIARFRSELVSKPMLIGQPVWAEIADYDPAPQIGTATVPAPGGRRELADLVAELSAKRQTSRGPLWEAWTIDGLASGRWALAVKISPVLADGGHGLESIWRRLTTAEPNGDNRLPTEVGPGPTPSTGELLADWLSEVIEGQVTGVWMAAETVTSGLLAVRRRLREVVDSRMDPETVSPMRAAVPDTVFNAALTKRRSMGLTSIPLADVRAISDAFGGSTANVVLAACAMSLRSWLQRHEAVPDDPLLVTVPLSRPTGDAAEDAHPLGIGYVRLPVHVDDPVQVLTDLHTSTERLNIAHLYRDESIDSPVDLPTVASLFPPWLARAGMQMFSGVGLRRRASSSQATVSFSSEDPGRAYCAGARVVAMYSSEPLTEGCGLNIGVTTHGEAMSLCVSACPDNVPRVDDIASGVAEAVGVLLAAAEDSPRGEGRSVVTELTSHRSRQAEPMRS